MSPQARSAVRVGVITTVVGSAALWLASIAWAQKVDKPEFDAFVNQIKRDQIRDSAWMAEQRQLTMDIYCSLNPRSQRCKP